jgi:hypothetical protein
MSEHRSPTPHHVYDEATNLESISVSRTMNRILAEVIYVEDLTPIPTSGQIAEFHVLGTSVQGIVNDTSLINVGEEVRLLIHAHRIHV